MKVLKNGAEVASLTDARGLRRRKERRKNFSAAALQTRTDMAGDLPAKKK